MGPFVINLDVQNAYCILPVHREDHQLLGMKWCGAFYVDMVLPFGVRSAPYIFMCLADLVEWIATRNNGVTFLMHYLDDFHTLSPLSSSVCQHNLDRSIQFFSKLGNPLHAWLIKPAGAATEGQVWQNNCPLGSLVTQAFLQAEGSGVLDWSSSTCTSYLTASLFCVTWLTCCAPSVPMTTPFVSTGGSFLT